MRKEKILISCLVLVLMLMIITPSLAERIVYENQTKQLFLSANMDDINTNKIDVREALSQYKSIGVNYATVAPKTLFSLKKEGVIDTIAFSSLSINEDPISREILSKLEPFTINSYSTVVLSKSPQDTDFIKNEIAKRYDDKSYIYVNINDNLDVFCFIRLKLTEDLIIGYDKNELNNVNENGLFLAIEYPSYTFENSLYIKFFSDFIKENNIKFLILRNNKFDNKKEPQKEFLSELKKIKLSLVVFENENQISNEKPSLYKYFFEIFKNSVIRGVNIDKVVEYDKTKYKYRYYQWFNSAVERNTTFINVNILKNEGIDTKENFELTKKSIQVFIDKMQKNSYKFPQAIQNISYKVNLQIATIAGFIVLLILLYLYILIIFGDKFKNLEFIFIGITLISIFFNYSYYFYVSQIYAGLIMIASISLLTLILFKTANKAYPNKIKLLILLLSPLVMLSLAIVVITALLSSIAFYTSTDLFYGVKISLIIPILTSVINYNIVFWKIKAFSEIWSKIKWLSKKINKMILIITGVFALLFLVYYLIRTGKSSFILPIEDVFRKTLTDIFNVRPRLKEFLVGYPVFFAFVYFAIYKKSVFIKPICGIIATILFTSILNTFCHTFADFQISLQRTFNGFICGSIITAILIALIMVVKMFFNKKNFFIKKS
jgi:hypothetical protein